MKLAGLACTEMLLMKTQHCNILAAVETFDMTHQEIIIPALLFAIFILSPFGVLFAIFILSPFGVLTISFILCYVLVYHAIDLR